VAISSTSRFTVPADVLSNTVSPSTVLLHLVAEQYFGLEGAGSVLWSQLAGGATFGDAVDAVFAEFEVDEQTARGDAAALVDHLLSAGLLLVA
jgi:hypothetical protein